jgi:DNA-binding Lrp family transcriptional regulator
MIKGYISVEVSYCPNDIHSESTKLKLESLDEIEEVHRLSRPIHNFFVVTREMPNSKSVDDLVQDKIQKIEGISVTHTYITREL